MPGLEKAQRYAEVTANVAIVVAMTALTGCYQQCHEFQRECETYCFANCCF